MTRPDLSMWLYWSLQNHISPLTGLGILTLASKEKERLWEKKKKWIIFLWFGNFLYQGILAFSSHLLVLLYFCLFYGSLAVKVLCSKIDTSLIQQCPLHCGGHSSLLVEVEDFSISCVACGQSISWPSLMAYMSPLSPQQPISLFIFSPKMSIVWKVGPSIIQQ